MEQPPIRFPVFKPLLPTADKLLPYIEKIDANRWYTNYGSLVLDFERGLARHFGVATAELTTSANATSAIAQTLRALGAPRDSLCVMPSWTFVATPAAALSAGLEPYFIDVDPTDWLIRPEQVLEIARSRQVGAVIVVSAFGAPLDIAAWDEFTRASGIPVLIDAASGFDSFGAPRLPEASITPVVISLHATKVSGVGEGAVVVTRDAACAALIRSYGNFGFSVAREAGVPGINAKMSEYTGAIGLAMLAEWPQRRAGWRRLSEQFAAEISATPGLRAAPGFNQGWVSSYGLVQFEPGVRAAEVASALRRRGIDSRQWWGRGCHGQPAYRPYGRGRLATTEALADQVLGLPFWLGLDAADLAEIFAQLRAVLAAQPKTACHA